MLAGIQLTHSVKSKEILLFGPCCLKTSIAVGIESCLYPAVAVYTSTRGTAWTPTLIPATTNADSHRMLISLAVDLAKWRLRTSLRSLKSGASATGGTAVCARDVKMAACGSSGKGLGLWGPLPQRNRTPWIRAPHCCLLSQHRNCHHIAFIMVYTIIVHLQCLPVSCLPLFCSRPARWQYADATSQGRRGEDQGQVDRGRRGVPQGQGGESGAVKLVRLGDGELCSVLTF